jgi:hypothetical protein
VRRMQQARARMRPLALGDDFEGYLAQVRF